MPPAMFQRRILSYPTDEKPAINCVNLGLITKSAYALSIKRFRFCMEGGTGFEPVDGGFADRSVSLFATRPKQVLLYQHPRILARLKFSDRK